MNKDEIYGVVRAVLAAVGGFAAGQGYVDSETAMTVAGAAATIIAAVWSIRSKRVANAA
jgi:hypothetical protein